MRVEASTPMRIGNAIWGSWSGNATVMPAGASQPTSRPMKMRWTLLCSKLTTIAMIEESAQLTSRGTTGQ
jgi:hypothetical protein